MSLPREGDDDVDGGDDGDDDDDEDDDGDQDDKDDIFFPCKSILVLVLSQK